MTPRRTTPIQEVTTMTTEEFHAFMKDDDATLSLDPNRPIKCALTRRAARVAEAARNERGVPTHPRTLMLDTLDGQDPAALAEGVLVLAVLYAQHPYKDSATETVEGCQQFAAAIESAKFGKKALARAFGPGWSSVVSLVEQAARLTAADAQKMGTATWFDVDELLLGVADEKRRRKVGRWVRNARCAAQLAVTIAAEWARDNADAHTFEVVASRILCAESAVVAAILKAEGALDADAADAMSQAWRAAGMDPVDVATGRETLPVDDDGAPAWTQRWAKAVERANVRVDELVALVRAPAVNVDAAARQFDAVATQIKTERVAFGVGAGIGAAVGAAVFKGLMEGAMR